jgi:hypothetical protein
VDLLGGPRHPGSRGARIFALPPANLETIIEKALLCGFAFIEEARMGKKTQRVEVCKCENCGNEGEMTVTCELVDVPHKHEPARKATKKQEIKSFTCTKCGNEAEMIIDL